VRRPTCLLWLLVCSMGILSAQAPRAVSSGTGDVLAGRIADWDLYQASTVNLLPASQVIDADWASQQCTSTANTTPVDPTGQHLAYKITENSGALGDYAYIYRGSVFPTGTWTGSTYMKPAGRTWGLLRFTISGGIEKTAWFDLTNQVTGTTDSGVTAAITDAGNGWSRLSISVTGTGLIHYVVGFTNADGAHGYTGDGTSGVYIFGNQINAGSTAAPYQATDYVPDSSGNSNGLTLTSGTTWNPYLTLPAGHKATAPFSLNTPFTVVILAQSSTNAGNQILMGGATGTPQIYMPPSGYLAFGKTNIAGLSQSLTVYGGTAPMALVLSYDGTTARWYHNGVPDSSVNVSTAFTPSTFTLGDALQPWAGSLYRARVYNRALSTWEARHVSEYWQKIYARRAAPISIPTVTTTALQLSQKQLLAQQLAVSFHYNMSTFSGSQWATPNLDPNTFAPTGLNIDQWLDTAVAGGAHSAMLTVKHHDGFALWPTAYFVPGYAPYSIAQTTWYTQNGSPDIVGLFVTKCREHHLLPMLYFSIWDRTYEIRSNTTAASGAANYLAMIETQLNELLTSYGQLSAIVTDGWGWSPAPTTPGDSGGGVGAYTNIPFTTISNYIKAIQPNVLFIDNNHQQPAIQSDFTTVEIPIQGYPSAPLADTTTLNPVGAMAWDTISDWFWMPIRATPQTSTALSSHLAAVLNANMLYLVNLSPDRTGSIPAEDAAAFSGITH
jgi:alpha-L-fucosidase